MCSLLPPEKGVFRFTNFNTYVENREIVCAETQPLSVFQHTGSVKNFCKTAKYFTILQTRIFINGSVYVSMAGKLGI